MNLTQRVRRHMARPVWFFIVAIIICSRFYPMLPIHADQPLSILILNSYHVGFQWTDNLTTGLVETIRKTSPSAGIFVEYLDWKRFPSEEVLGNQYELLKGKYEKTHFEAIITTDDAALAFAVKYREILFPGVPIIFGGVLKDAATVILKDTSNVTGIYEAVDPIGTRDMILSMHPNAETVFVFHDGTESGHATRDAFSRAFLEKHPQAEITDYAFAESNSTPQILSQAGLNSVAVIVSLYAKIDNKVSEPIDFAAFISSSGIPTYSVYEYSLGGGIVGGSLLSGYQHGQAMGELTSRVIAGEEIKNLPISSELTVVAKVDDQVIRRLDIPRKLIPPFTTLVNNPFSFFETYRVLVISTLSVLTALIVLVFLLTRSNRARIKAEVELLANHKELKQTYVELTATHDELGSTHEELIASQVELLEQYEHLEVEQVRNNRLAHYDPLTGLPNRLLLKDTVDQAITNAKDNTHIVLLFIDTDNFKLINDSFGHVVGDLLLVEIGKRLLSITYEKGLAARLGGDEFIIIQEPGDQEDMDTLAKTLLDVFELPFYIADNTFHISVSIGVVQYPEHGLTFDELLKNADTSMYQAKDAGKGRYTVFTNEMNETIVMRSNLQRMMRASLEKNEFSLYYQPKVDAKTRKIVGFEALCRWIQPDGSMIPPDKFIPIAEETGLIVHLGSFVLRETCRFAQRIKVAGFTDLPVSVNVSVVQLTHTQYVDSVLEAFKECNLLPSDIVLEITESVLMESYDTNIYKLFVLSQSGVTLSLDDFGSGYSSLTYLKQMPLSEIKIDKSFIQDLTRSPDQAGIIQAIVQLAKQLNLNVVAEGVETVEQAELLTEVGCTTLQGYLFGTPKPESAIFELLQTGTACS